MEHPVKTMFLPLILLTLAAAPGEPQRRNDQRAAFEARRAGGLTIREIEARVIPRMRGARYLGFDFDGVAGVYTLKFLRDGAVIWVEVNARSGRILGQSGD